MSLSQSIMTQLSALKNKSNIQGMKRFGINVDQAFGIKIPVLRSIAKSHKNNHDLAADLWNSGFHEARILASMIDDPKLVTHQQMDSWVKDFNSWDLCDQVCTNLFTRSPAFREKIVEYSQNPHEFIKRSAFAMIASFTSKGKSEKDETFLSFFELIEEQSNDDRVYVKKAVSWALRSIGKKNRNLCAHALELSEKLKNGKSKSARWIGSDAYRELVRKFGSN